MAYWEFLFQKDGDRGWFPLNSQEIEEGRYRIVANTSRKNCDIDIRITYQTVGETPPRRRTQTRSRRTNEEGLMVIIPYTYLRKGVWEFRCTGDLMSDLAGESWQESVRLEVQPRSHLNPFPHAQFIPSEASEEIEHYSQTSIPSPAEEFPPAHPPQETETAIPVNITSDSLSHSSVTETEIETPVPTNITLNETSDSLDTAAKEEEKDTAAVELEKEVEPEIATPALAAEVEVMSADTSNDEETESISIASSLLEESLKSLEDILQQVVEPMVQEIEDVVALPPDKNAPQQASEPVRHLQTGEKEKFEISLNQDTLIREDGKAVSISGQLTSLNGSQLSDLKGELRLCYELRNPQTSKVLFQTQFPLSLNTLPTQFSHSLEIPENCKLHLILGEVLLEIGSPDSPIVLANQPFTITADVAELLGAIFPSHSPTKASSAATSSDTPPIEPSEEATTPPLEETQEKSKNLIRADFVEVAKKGKASLQLQPIASQALPAKLERVSSTQSRKSPELPVLPKPVLPEVERQETAPAKEIAQENYLSSANVEAIESSSPETPIVDTEKEPETTPSPEISEEEIKVLKSLVNTELDDPEEETKAIEAEQIGVQPFSATKTDELTLSEGNPVSSKDEFQQLNLEKRFWSHLNALVVDHDSSDWLLDTPAAVEEAEETEAELQTVDQEGETLEAEDNFLELDAEVETQGEDSSLDLETQGEDNSVQLQDDFETDHQQGLENHFADWEEASGLLFTEEEISVALSPLEEPPQTKEESVVELTTSETETISLETSPIVEEDPQLEVNSQKVAFVEEVWPPTEIAASEEATDNAEKAVDPANWVNYEIVVEDDEVYISPPAKPKHDTSGLPYPQKITPPKRPSPVLARQQLEIPVPQPQIILPAGELTAGDMLIIRVSLSPYPRSVYVKLWIQDRQTRMLLDGPRALVDFEVNEAGEWETLTQLSVPYGSMEVRFEAIAIDTETQQESHKTSLDRVVVPENLPQFSLEGL